MTAIKVQESYSQIDIAPTAALILGIELPRKDGRVIDGVTSWGCKNIVLIIVDSLGYDLLESLLPDLENIRGILESGLLIKAISVSNRTTPSIASILCGLLPENHGIFDKAGAKESSVLSLPEIATSAGQSCAVIMEQNGADVYEGLVESIYGIPDSIPQKEFDEAACRLTRQALLNRPRLLVSYFIGIDKSAHLGHGLKGIREAALRIDSCIGKVVEMVDQETLLIICGDHPVHAGPLKRDKEPYCVAIVLAKGRAGRLSSEGFR